MDNINTAVSPLGERTLPSDERMDIVMNDRQLVCVEYPGIVENTDRAIHTLGGIQSINRSIKDETKRLELHFRPEDVYSKPACGVLHKTTGLVLRVRRRKRVTSSSVGAAASAAANPHNDGYEYQMDILGTVSSAIRFQGMCDFQYLPVARQAGGSYENLLDKLVMKPFTSEEDYMSRKTPLFLSPIIFSRFDTPQDYGFLLKKRKRETGPMLPVETLTTDRKVRQKFTTVISFTDPTPQKATDECLAFVQKFKESGLLDKMHKLFEERPIWSRSALLYQLRHEPRIGHNLKEALPAFAYFFLNGPWRTFWVKMGYDPRQDPSSKRFQGIDFRRQKGPGDILKEPPTQKKKDYYRKKDVASEINLTFLKVGEVPEAGESKEPKLKDFEFHADVLPPYRQIVYMVCDIYDDKVQALVSKNDGRESKCTERNGWCVTKFADRCRTIMNQHVSKLCPNQLPRSQIYARKKRRQIQKALQMSDEDISMETTVGDSALSL